MKTKINSVSDLKSGLKNRTAKLGEGIPPHPIDFGKRRFNRALPTERVLHLLRTQAPRFWEMAEVVGKWIWIEFDGRQPREITSTLSELGFHWNNRRQLWQHPCGEILNGANFDPRRRYGSYFPADHQAAA